MRIVPYTTAKYLYDQIASHKKRIDYFSMMESIIFVIARMRKSGLKSIWIF